jgi:hypothetical protein
MDIAIRSADAGPRLVVAERALELHRWILEDPPGASILGEVAKQRDALELLFAADPLVALDRARTDLTGWTTTPDRGLSRALARLQRMRDRTRGSALEDLRPGATRLWFDFLMELDPRAALNFAQDEVRLRTADPDLWRMLAEANEQNDARTSAVDLREFLQASLPAAVDARALVRLHALGGDDPDGFEDAFTAVLVQEGLVEPDEDLALQRARFLVESGKDSWAEARERLATLWSEHAERYLAPPPPQAPPDPVADERPPLFGGNQPDLAPATDGPWLLATTHEQSARTLEVGRLYARLLAWMGRPEDAATLDGLTRTLEGLQQDRLASEVLVTLRALAPRPRTADPD